MRIGRLRVQNYRSHLSTEVDFDEYTALIGANGAGKSSLFYALQWFFEGGPISDCDINQDALGKAPDTVTVSVSVSFTNLTDADRRRLKEYGRGEFAHFTRIWTKGEDKSKVIGNALAGPGFSAIRQETKVTAKRAAYKDLRDRIHSLPELRGTVAGTVIDQTLADWESDPVNEPCLEPVNHLDANHLFGINGPNVIRECLQFILVPAATDISANIGVAGKGSTLSELVGAVSASAGAKARDQWMKAHEKELSELYDAIEKSISSATQTQAARINARLSSFIPNASVSFDTSVPDWAPKGDASVSTLITLGDSTGDLANQGHGTQRAVMIAMFHAIAPDEASAVMEAPRASDETDDAYNSRLQTDLDNLPALVICIEEPEIYQHPIRARAFARVLWELAERGGAQVAVATHSPYFVRPNQFEHLRRLRLIGGRTVVSSTDLQTAADSAGLEPAKLKLNIERQLPTTFSEGFFADAVVLVEGDTDKACLEGLAEILEKHLDLAGISVMCVGGKNEFKMAYGILCALDVPVYVVADGDAGRAADKHPTDPVKLATAHESNERQTMGLVSWLPDASVRFGSLPYLFGSDTVVTDRYAIWHDDLEAELANWPTFCHQLTCVGGALREKKVFNYRAAALAADASDAPRSIMATVHAVVEMVSTND